MECYKHLIYLFCKKVNQLKQEKFQFFVNLTRKLQNKIFCSLRTRAVFNIM